MTEAERFSGINKSGFSRFLKNHYALARQNLTDLSKRQAKKAAKVLEPFCNGGLPFKIAIIIDATIQGRSTRHTQNGKKFNHGKGFVIGHQWTNVVLFINGVVIPLLPIPFYSKNYCKEKSIEYNTEHDHIVAYIKALDLEEYVGVHDPKEVVVLTDSGYDSRKVENAILEKEWHFITALSLTRSVKSEKKFKISSNRKDWTQIADWFERRHWLKWETVRFTTKLNTSKNKRMEFRVREILGHIRDVGLAKLICSEYKKRLNSRTKYLACSAVKLSARQILMAYRLRWLIEIFHKQVKMHLGFQDVSPTCFDSVVSHVHWVYCAYILMQEDPPGISSAMKFPNKKQKIKEVIESKEIRKLRLTLSNFGGVDRLKNELAAALQLD